MLDFNLRLPHSKPGAPRNNTKDSFLLVIDMITELGTFRVKKNTSIQSLIQYIHYIVTSVHYNLVKLQVYALKLVSI